MKLSLRFLLLLIPVLAGMILGFNLLMEPLERRWTLLDISNRSRLIYDSTQEPILDALTTGRLKSLLRIYNRISQNDPNFVGVMVCSLKNDIVSSSGGLPKGIRCDWKGEEEDFKKFNVSEKSLTTIDDRLYHKAYFPLYENDERYRGYVLIVHKTTYLAERSELTRKYTTLAFLGLALFISLITLLVYRWAASRPVEQMTEVLKGILTGDTEKIINVLEESDFSPLVKDLDQVLVEARQRKKVEDDGSRIWTAGKLSQEVQRLFGDSRVCIVAQHEPHVHERIGSTVQSRRPASGVVAAMEPVLRASSGFWIGQAFGAADKETADKNGVILVPPNQPEYALKRIWLTRDEEQGFFYGFSNGALWPLCHVAHERPIFKKEDWECFVSVNAKFASTFNEEIKSTRPILIVNDYHMSLVPSMVRKMRPDALIGMVWHPPWPTPEMMRICPWKNELLEGILGANLIVFQQRFDANNFLDTVSRLVEARVSKENSSVTIGDRTCYVRTIPAGVEWPQPFASAPEKLPELKKNILRELGISSSSVFGLGVDRMDYTKGIIEKFQSIERFLEKNPQFVEKFSFLQIVSPSRTHSKRYQELNSEIQKEADRVNWKFYHPNYQPIVLKMHYHTQEEISDLYQIADFCFINPIHDGMNLVSKEFVSSRTDESGVLILSQFAGAATELKEAIMVNPYDQDECARAILEAIQMSPDEKRRRMRRMRETVSNNNAYAWGAKFFAELQKVSEQGI